MSVPFAHSRDESGAFAPGLYFGLPMEDYRADPALSFSGIKDILVSPLTYWANSPLNPDREEESTDAMALGTAFHARLVEGAEAFGERYAILPRKEDHEGALDGGDALRAKCKELGLKASGSIAEMCERIREKDPEAILWPLVIEEFKAANEGKILLKPEVAERIEGPAKIIDAHPSARKAFTGGYAEVSIFWLDEETGIRLKARIDYLKLRAGVDLKSFSNPLGKPVDVAVAGAMANGRYHIQGVTYSEAIEQAKRLVRALGPDAVHGEVDPAWVQELVKCPEHGFVFVFLESGRVPNLRVKEFRRVDPEGGKGSHGENLYWQAGLSGFRRGVELYAACIAKFGPDRPWFDDRPTTPFRDEDFPLWMMEA